MNCIGHLSHRDSIPARTDNVSPVNFEVPTVGACGLVNQHFEMTLLPPKCPHLLKYVPSHTGRHQYSHLLFKSP